MGRNNPDLHGNAPDASKQALVLIDVINDLEFPTGPALVRHALSMARSLARLKARARKAGVPVIYVNDNFGKWKSDFQAQIAHCLGDGVRGAPVVRQLMPDPEDYYVLKPKHSGFFESPLDLLLGRIGAETLILTGLTADSCVFFTACDAYLRDYRLLIPSDCVASPNLVRKRQALDWMRTLLKADVKPGARVRLERTRPRGTRK